MTNRRWRFFESLDEASLRLLQDFDAIKTRSSTRLTNHGGGRFFESLDEALLRLGFF